MSHFVLVPGAWLGAWAWERVVPRLEAAGHSAEPITLSGVADSATSPAEVDLQTHAADVAAAVRRAPQATVVVVSHSYSGVPVLQAVDGLGEAVSSVVHVDSVVCGDGEAFADPDSGWGSRLQGVLDENGGLWPPQLDQLQGQGLSDADIRLIGERATGHPGRSLTQRVHLTRPLSAVPTAYLHCLLDTPELDDDVRVLADTHGWAVEHLDTGHWPMLSEPELLAQALIRHA
jgi:pimeloyl-ACP methyl ester carboxylesterase